MENPFRNKITYQNSIMLGTICTNAECNPQHTPDFGDIASRRLASTLVCHKDKLHLITWLKTHTILHFRHMKEQLLSFVYFIGQKSKYTLKQ
jgi:hypothetical protein